MREERSSSATQTGCRQADGTLYDLLLIITYFFLPFLPMLPLHAVPATPGTLADLLRFRSRRECQAGCTGRCAQFRAAEYRNCRCASFCGPSWFFPPVRYEIVKIQLSCGWSAADGMAPFSRNGKCRRLSSQWLDGRLHFFRSYYITLRVGVNSLESGCDVEQ